MGDHGLPCVHCGLCLDSCPTYRLLGVESESPRGRLYLMDAIAKGEMALDADAAGHLSRCLGCLACEAACPSGVDYGHRIEEVRPLLAARRDPQQAWKAATRSLYTNDALVDAGLATARLMDRAGLSSLRRRMPGLGLLPGDHDGADADTTPLRRSREHQPLRPRARAALLTGCVGDRMRPGINRDAVEMLQRCGVEVVEVPGQGCCGALALHAGDRQGAMAAARANTAAFLAADVDFIVSTAAGCGAMLADYGHLLEATPEHEAAQALASAARDVCEVLVEMGLEPPPAPLSVEGTVAYHDACHLLHARGIADAPRLVCEAAVGRVPVDLGENAICCGSAGSYNLDHPSLATALGERKAELAREGEVAVLAVANVGCMLQIAQALARGGSRARVAHPVQLLAEAWRQGPHQEPRREPNPEPGGQRHVEDRHDGD